MSGWSAAARKAKAERDPNIGGNAWRKPTWKGPTSEVYPETIAEFDLENPDESYDALADATDDMPPTMAHRTLRLAWQKAYAYGSESRAAIDEGEPRDRRLTKLKGLKSVESLVQHHAVRALEYHVESAFTLEDWMRIRLSFQGCCAYCGTEAGNRLTIEHVIAMVHGGPNTPANIVAACGPCNSSKNRKPLLDWLEKKGFDPAVVFKRINEAQARQRGES